MYQSFLNQVSNNQNPVSTNMFTNQNQGQSSDPYQQVQPVYNEIFYQPESQNSLQYPVFTTFQNNQNNIVPQNPFITYQQSPTNVLTNSQQQPIIPVYQNTHLQDQNVQNVGFQFDQFPSHYQIELPVQQPQQVNGYGHSSAAQQPQPVNGYGHSSVAQQPQQVNGYGHSSAAQQQQLSLPISSESLQQLLQQSVNNPHNANTYQVQPQPVPTYQPFVHNAAPAPQQQGLAQLIPLLANLQNSGQSTNSPISQKKLLLVKILKRLVEAIKTGTFTRQNKQVNIPQQKLAQLRNILQSKLGNMGLPANNQRQFQQQRPQQQQGRPPFRPGGVQQRPYRPGLAGKQAKNFNQQPIQQSGQGPQGPRRAIGQRFNPKQSQNTVHVQQQGNEEYDEYDNEASYDGSDDSENYGNFSLL
jgi:hypothetical protein